MEFPAVPAMTTLTRELGFNEDRLERTIATYADGVVYAVYTFKYGKRRPSLEEIMKEFPRSPQNFKRELTVGQIPGKEYGFQNEELTGVTQFYLAEKCVYVFEVLASSLGNIETGIPKFFNSIRFGKDPEGQPMVDGPGVQPESPPLKPDEIFSGKNVTRKVKVVTKPEPSYSALARKNQIAGTVVIRAVFSSNGTVTNLHVVSSLPDGLDEKSLGAARQIRFIPAIKDGHFVSMWMELQYNFNLY